MEINTIRLNPFAPFYHQLPQQFQCEFSFFREGIHN